MNGMFSAGVWHGPLDEERTAADADLLLEDLAGCSYTPIEHPADLDGDGTADLALLVASPGSSSGAGTMAAYLSGTSPSAPTLRLADANARLEAPLDSAYVLAGRGVAETSRRGSGVAVALGDCYDGRACGVWFLPSPLPPTGDFDADGVSFRPTGSIETGLGADLGDLDGAIAATSLYETVERVDYATGTVRLFDLDGSL
ncbi:MAG: hypothetical protein FJ102_23750 [Deltaproteobacteria bacterium]|nr:hypothetical protein [Deltaproteobacteria bacterium]